LGGHGTTDCKIGIFLPEAMWKSESGEIIDGSVKGGGGAHTWKIGSQSPGAALKSGMGITMEGPSGFRSCTAGSFLPEDMSKPLEGV
jgi:hypothetical protein